MLSSQGPLKGSEQKVKVQHTHLFAVDVLVTMCCYCCISSKPADAVAGHGSAWEPHARNEAQGYRPEHCVAVFVAKKWRSMWIEFCSSQAVVPLVAFTCVMT